jgi:glycosyltransferase involved in cell wall biosynthesis
MKISVCSQIKNRLYQFSKTFLKNIETLEKYQDIEWIIVDCGSSDRLSDYIEEYLEKYNFIKYYQAINFKYSIPIAKNFSARLSTGDYIFNLDCDNYLDNIVDEIRSSNQGVSCDEYLKGSHGRIGMSKEVFVQLGGYDENFYPAGVHDNDIVLRANYLNYKFKNIPSVTSPVSNNKKDTVKDFEKGIDWETMVKYNEVIMKYNEKKKILNPNNGIFTSCSFIYNLKNSVEKTNEF